jgi:peptide/nickel transport system substrate-binding protein
MARSPSYTGPMIAKRSGIAFVLCLALLGGACSETKDSKEESGSTSQAASGANDISATDRDELVDGGKLTWPIDTFPSNFNLHELDGALADGAAVMGGLLPGMFNFDAEAEPVVNKDYATSAELTATQPKQVVTYKINPDAKWDDGTPITVADFEAQWKALNGKDDRYRIASSNGYEKIESVAKGADEDRKSVV